MLCKEPVTPKIIHTVLIKDGMILLIESQHSLCIVLCYSAKDLLSENSTDGMHLQSSQILQQHKILPMI